MKKHKFVFKTGPLFRGGTATMDIFTIDGEPMRGLRKAEIFLDASAVTIVRLEFVPEEVEVVIDPEMGPGWGSENPEGPIVEGLPPSYTGDPKP